MRYLFIILGILSISSCTSFKGPARGFSKLEATMYYMPRGDSSGIRTYPNMDSVMMKYHSKGTRLNIFAEKDNWYAFKLDSVDLFVLKDDVKPLDSIQLSDAELNGISGSYPFMWLSSNYDEPDYIDYKYCEDNVVDENKERLIITLKSGWPRTFVNIDEDENHSFEEYSEYRYKGTHKNFGAIIQHIGFEWWEYIVLDLNNAKEYIFGGIPFLSPDQKYVVVMDYNPYDEPESDIVIYERGIDTMYRLAHYSYNTWEYNLESCGDLSGTWDKEGNFYFNIKIEGFQDVYQQVKLDFSRLRQFSRAEQLMYFVPESGSKGIRAYPNKDSAIVKELKNGSILNVQMQSGEWYVLYQDQFILKKDAKPLDYLKLSEADLNNTTQSTHLHLYSHKLPEFEEYRDYGRDYYDRYVSTQQVYNSDISDYVSNVIVKDKKKQKKVFESSKDIKYKHMGTCDDVGIIIRRVTNGVSENIVINKNNGEEYNFPGFPALTMDNKFIVSINFDSIRSISTIMVYGMDNDSIYVADSVSYDKWRVDFNSLGNLDDYWDYENNLYFNVAPTNFECAYQSVKLDFLSLRKHIEDKRTKEKQEKEFNLKSLNEMQQPIL